MFYRIEEETVKVVSATGLVRNVAVPRGKTISVAENQSGVVSVVTWPDESKVGLLVCDPETGKTSLNLLGVFYDSGWVDENTLWVSDGKTIRLYSEQGRESVELCKYSKVPYGPLDLRVSPDRSLLGFLRWQGDHRKATFVFVGSRECIRSKHSCHSLSLRNAREALLEHGGSIYKLDILTDTKTVVLKSIKRLIAKISRTESLELKNIQSIVNDPTCSIDHVGNPFEVHGRIYFSSFVCSDSKKYVSLVSTGSDLEDPKVHLQFTQGLVRGICISRDGNYVAIRLWPNTLLKEEIAGGWYFSSGGKNGFLEDAEPSSKENFA